MVALDDRFKGYEVEPEVDVLLDRSIREYCRDIWLIEQVPIPASPRRREENGPMKGRWGSG
jgi:hypothetical protein